MWWVSRYSMLPVGRCRNINISGSSTSATRTNQPCRAPHWGAHSFRSYWAGQPLKANSFDYFFNSNLGWYLHSFNHHLRPNRWFWMLSSAVNWPLSSDHLQDAFVDLCFLWLTVKKIRIHLRCGSMFPELLMQSKLDHLASFVGHTFWTMNPYGCHHRRVHQFEFSLDSRLHLSLIGPIILTIAHYRRYATLYYSFSFMCSIS